MHHARAAAVAAAFALTAALGAPARADTIHLANGQVLENVKAEDLGPRGIAATRPGVRIILLRDEVLSIEKSETPEEALARLISEAHGDPDRLEAAARFARENRLTDRGREVEEMLADARLERALAGVDRHDADALYEVAMRATEAKAPRAAIERVLRLALLANPDHEPSHRALGEARFDGRWLPEAEVERALAEREAAAMRARGLVFYEGAWVTPEAQRFEKTRQELAAELEAARKLRAELEAGLAEVRARTAALDARERALDAREAALDDRARFAAGYDGRYADRGYGVSAGVVILQPSCRPERVFGGGAGFVPARCPQPSARPIPCPQPPPRLVTGAAPLAPPRIGR
jgi:hypothetical protein